MTGRHRCHQTRSTMARICGNCGIALVSHGVCAFRRLALDPGTVEERRGSKRAPGLRARYRSAQPSQQSHLIEALDPGLQPVAVRNAWKRQLSEPASSSDCTWMVSAVDVQKKNHGRLLGINLDSLRSVICIYSHPLPFWPKRLSVSLSMYPCIHQRSSTIDTAIL